MVILLLPHVAKVPAPGALPAGLLILLLWQPPHAATTFAGICEAEQNRTARLWSMNAFDSAQMTFSKTVQLSGGTANVGSIIALSGARHMVSH